MACAVAILLVTGCTDNSEALLEPVSSAEYFQEILKEARASGASAQQISVLEAAAEAGEVTYSDVVGQIEYLQACIEDAGGLFFRENDDKIGPDLVAPGYRVAVPGLDDENGLSVIESCENLHLDFVMGSLWLQPTTVAARDAEYEASLPQIIACLREHGVVVEDDALIDEVKVLQMDLGGTTGIICYEPSWW